MSHKLCCLEKAILLFKSQTIQPLENEEQLQRIMMNDNDDDDDDDDEK